MDLDEQQKIVACPSLLIPTTFRGFSGNVFEQLLYLLPKTFKNCRLLVTLGIPEVFQRRPVGSGKLPTPVSNNPISRSREEKCEILGGRANFLDRVLKFEDKTRAKSAGENNSG